MMQRQFSFTAFVLAHERECGGSDGFGDAETAGDAFDEFGFARTEVAFEADDPAGLGLRRP